MTHVKKIVYIAIFSALIAVCSMIQIPYVIPFTLQTFAVFLTLLCIGGKLGTISIIVYILLGIVGLPVFSGFTAGIRVIMSQTGGYILGFALVRIVYMIFEKIKFKFNDIVSLLIGLILLYISGTVWFVFVASNPNGVGFAQALMTCVVPFVIPDLIKLALAVFIQRKLIETKAFKTLKSQ